jgi:imidazolonepropionase-like amidohydrolase/Tol biopolymer transport system component
MNNLMLINGCFKKSWRRFASIAALSTLPFISVQAEDTKWDVNNPQGEFSEAKIHVTEGTWMNIDVSPDGKKIVFDMLGDIYLMSINGGKVTALTQDIAWQMQPTFSPDGKLIAFTSDQGGGDNIWVMNTDGSGQTAVTNETFRLLNSPAWSPDGEFLVARKHFTGGRSLGAGEVWMYHKSGGSGVQLTKKPNQQKDLGEPAFSPDGKYIYFSQDTTPGAIFHYSKDSVGGIYQIKRFERETGEIEVMLRGLGGAIRPTPSPDGRTLAYISRDDFQSSIFLYDLASGKKQKLYGKLDRDMQETWAIHGVYPTMEWTPDNKHLVFWAGGKIRKINVKTGKDKDISFEIETTKKIQKALRFQQVVDADKFDVKMLRWAQISPDGKKVVFEALGKLYQRALPNGKPKRLTRQKSEFELFPSFSRDGKKIVYTTWNDKTQGSVKVVSSRGGKGKAITKDKGKFVEPVFAPNGKHIVYRKISGGRITDPSWDVETGVYRIATKGGKAEKISNSGNQPQFGSRNDVVYAMGYSGESPSFFAIDIDKKKQRQLYTASHATEFRISPDGQYLAWAERFKVFVTPFVERGNAIHIGPTANQMPVKKLSQKAGESISWTADSQRLYWSLGPELYQAALKGKFDIQMSDTDTIKTSDSEPDSSTSKRAAAEENKSIKPINIGFQYPMAKPKQVIALTGARIITMEGEQVIESGTLIVTDNKITAIGADVEIPEDAKVVDLKGKTIIPGLVDVHAHGSQGNNEIIPQQNWLNYAALTFGVTTFHDPSNDTTEFFAASELQKSGRILAPRLYSTGTILYGANAPGYTSHVDSLDDAKFHLERLKKVGAFSVKSYNQPRRNQRQQVVQAGRELEMMVVPEGGSLLQHNLTMIIDGHTGVEHSIPVAEIYQDIEQLWSQSKTGYTPTLGVGYGGIWGEKYWYDKTDVWAHPRLSKYVPENILRPVSMRRDKAPDHHYNHISNAKVAAKLRNKGVLVNLGAHGQREGLAAHWEIWMFHQGGMTPHQALKAATLDSAAYVGLDQSIGSIKVGKLADLAIIDGNPLEDIRVSDKVSHVMINGRLLDADTMNDVFGKQKRNKFFFEK